MLKNKKVRLPAITVEVPRMGIIVYTSPKVGVQDNKWTCMFTAEISVKGNIELQSFHLKCNNEKKSKEQIKMFTDRLITTGPFPFIQHSI